MSELLTALPPAVVVLAAALLAPWIPRRVAHAFGFAATAGVAAWSLALPEGTYLATTFLGFDAVFLHVDDLSRLMGLIFGFIGAAAVVYSHWSDASATQTGYALAYVGTSVGAVFSGDWLTLVFFWELMAITSTLLVWHHGGAAVRAGFRYALWHGAGGSLLMAGAIWHYVEVESFLFTGDGIVAGIPAALVALGVGVNVGFVGLHVWLPDTYPRPHLAASVFLCVYTTKTGVYALGRAFPEGHLWIAYMGGAMAVFGAFVALLQDDMRRLLSYHIQSQVGYMVAGVGIGSALAYSGAFAHVYNHILYKGLLFMTAGVIIYRTDVERLKKLGGLGREMPITAVVFAVAALSISGFPGFNGFVSKGMVVAAAHEEHVDVLWYMLLLGSVGTFLSFVKFGYFAFLNGESDREVADANLGQTVAMVVVAALCVLYGVYPAALFAILPGTGAAEAHPYTPGHVGEVLAIAAVAVVIFALVRNQFAKVGHVPDVDAVYNRVGLYGARALVVGVTEAYAAVDRAVVRATGTVRAATNQPSDVVVAVRAWADEDRDEPTALRTDVGTSTLLVVVVLTAVLFVVYWV